MLMTPAIASEPYCADAPSLNTSILLIAETGMAFKSVPEFPRPLVPKIFTRDDWCLRLPLIKTRVWSGPKPRKRGWNYMVGTIRSRLLGCIK